MIDDNYWTAFHKYINIRDRITHGGKGRESVRLSCDMDLGSSRVGRMITIVELMGRVIVAGVFLFAAFPKLSDIDSFARVIEAYGFLPESLIYPVALLLPPLEVVLAVGILFGYGPSLIAGFWLMICFIAVLAYAIHMGLDIDCGCFGPSDPEYTAFQGLRSALIRDLLLLLPLLLSIWRRYRKQPVNILLQGEKIS